jgi:hypothetical protein
MQGNGRNSGRRIFRQRQTGNRQEHGNAVPGFRLRGHLMAQMAVRTLRLVHGIMVVPAADHYCGKDQQREQRQRDSQNSDCVSDRHSIGFAPVTKPS